MTQITELPSVGGAFAACPVPFTREISKQQVQVMLSLLMDESQMEDSKALIKRCMRRVWIRPPTVHSCLEDSLLKPGECQ